ncbi:MAG TPA: TAXI family TRAP transporter solute-binding subunit [Spirochaetia bacterium]|nr:TAXI family TRAP transporter solute-binding subunit [Spirochaetales bacterium]HRY79608.1 TAXI family TRAP transporter solute-binding subunit [Spirochaetia bacterium]HRZ89250.1 TAXI family TRAP transporter solute-binding subunit [Spirochaetia bacterium]
MKRSIAILGIAVLLVAALLIGCQPKEVKPTFINIATGGTAGTYFPLGGALAEIWNTNIKGMNATAQSTGASVANINLLRDGKNEVIMVQNDICYYAVNGLEMFKDKAFADIRGLVTLYNETCQVVTLADKGINGIADLKGKRVAVGAAGSGAEANARQILEAAGLSYSDLTAQYLSFAEAANNLKDGNIDAAFVTAGHPTAAIQDIAASRKVALVNISPEIITAITSKYPYYTPTTIPAGTYTGVDVPVSTVAVKAMLAVKADLDAKVAYEMVKTMYANTERLKAAHKVGSQITVDTGKAGMPLTLHPGAEKFFKEAGK